MSLETKIVGRLIKGQKDGDGSFRREPLSGCKREGGFSFRSLLVENPEIGEMGGVYINQSTVPSKLIALLLTTPPQIPQPFKFQIHNPQPSTLNQHTLKTREIPRLPSLAQPPTTHYSVWKGTGFHHSQSVQ